MVNKLFNNSVFINTILFYERRIKLDKNKENNNDKIFRSGFVSILGRTNVGKSSIMNSLIKEKVSAIANKPQTTRTAIRGILTTEDFQVVFVDTPGIHKPKSKLGDIMVETAYGISKDVDLILFVIDASSKDIGKGDQMILEKIKESKKKCILVLNKTDLTSKENLANLISLYSKEYDFKAVVPVSVVKNNNLDVLLTEIKNNLDEGPLYYSEDEYTDQSIRDLVEETIREKSLNILKDEVPHGILVECSKVKMGRTEENERFYNIDATIYCVRESHKGIIIGKGGQMLKRIGTQSRIELEKMLNMKVNLNLWVKVKKDWINDTNLLKKFKFNNKDN